MKGEELCGFRKSRRSGVLVIFSVLYGLVVSLKSPSCLIFVFLESTESFDGRVNI